MAVDQDPFTDVRVRQAMRLIVDRDAMVEQVLSGYGRVANDLYSPLDAAYIGNDLPQRKRDIEGAKKLLADAGKSDLTIDLFAPNDTAALGAMVQLFAENAKDAGITVNAQVIDGGTYWGDEYLKRTFATDYWGTRNFLLQVAAGSLKDAVAVSRRSLAARRTRRSRTTTRPRSPRPTTPSARSSPTRCRRSCTTTVGLIIPFFQNLLDAYNGRVQGLVERPNTLNLDHYGRGWKNLYFSE